MLSSSFHPIAFPQALSKKCLELREIHFENRCSSLFWKQRNGERKRAGQFVQGDWQPGLTSHALDLQTSVPSITLPPLHRAHNQEDKTAGEGSKSTLTFPFSLFTGSKRQMRMWIRAIIPQHMSALISVFFVDSLIHCWQLKMSISDA